MDGPHQMRFCRLQCVQQRQAAVVHLDARWPQTGQLTQQKAGFIGIGVKARMRAEDDLPAGLLRCR